MKNNNTHYLQFNRIANNQYHMQNMSDACYRLYGALKELEQIYCDFNDICFFCTDKQLASMLNWSISKLERTKRELKDFPELVEIEAKRYIKYNGEQSAEPVTYYTLK